MINTTKPGRRVGLRKLSIEKDPELVDLPESGAESTHPAVFSVGSPGRLTESESIGSGPRLDLVLSTALRNGRISRAQVSTVGMKSSGSDAALSWRQFALEYPFESDYLFELAAGIYGFRHVTVCQIGTLIYNNKLTDYFSATDWNRLFDRGVVPVIEFGHYPEVVRHHLLATSDPGSRYIRSLQHELPLSHTELVFVPRSGIQRLQTLLVSNISELNLNPFVTQRAIPEDRPAMEPVIIGRKAA